MLVHRIDRARRMVLLTGSGALTAAEVLGVQERLRADPDFDPSFRLLADYRAATTFDFDTSKLRQVAANVPFDPATRRAFVVHHDADFGVLRMFEALSELSQRGGRVRIFRDIAAARQWLEAPEIVSGT